MFYLNYRFDDKKYKSHIQYNKLFEFRCTENNQSPFPVSIGKMVNSFTLKRRRTNSNIDNICINIITKLINSLEFELN